MNDTCQPGLFPFDEDSSAAPVDTLQAAASLAPPRLRRAERFQAEMRCESLDQRLAADHVARTLWRLVEAMNLTALLKSIKAVEGSAGRDATDPKILMAVWLFAFSQGQSSAREVARLCQQHRAYEWLCGGVSLNHRLLGEFRVAHWDVLNTIFTDTIGALLHEGLLDLDTTAQDGMRVRANAGTSSFRRAKTLQESLAQAQAHIERLHVAAEADPLASTRRERAARQRAAQERVERITAALDNIQELQRQRESRAKGSGAEARVSTTDPEARKMKMPDGGFRPAYNVQFATDVGSGLIVGVDVTNQGTDAGLMDPMVEQIEERLDQTPTYHLTDGGFSTVEDIDKVTQRGTTVLTPIKDEDKKKAAGVDPYVPLAKDSPAVAAWRERMGTDEAKTRYQLRGQAAELSNAHARNRNLYQVRVRSLAKVRVIALWYALVHNLVLAGTVRARRAKAAQTQA